MAKLDSAFDDDHAARYDEQFAALAPVKDALHLSLNLALDALADDARVLIVGAGTGQEMLALATAHPNWRFVAVDPSAAMLDRCRTKAQQMGVLDRCRLHVGSLDTLPREEPFQAATSILVSHFFTERDQRRAFFALVKEHLQASGLLVSADLSAEVTEEAQRSQLALWRVTLGRAMPAEQVDEIMSLYGTEVALSSTVEMQELLKEAGFLAPLSVYQFGAIRAWLART